MEYQVETQDFYVPSLTIQPLMENAIKHGVLKRVEGGTVRLRTSQDDNFWYVEIEDNGVGFASEGPEGESPDGHSGIGICNIERRLEYYCNAAFFIHSVPGQGTFVRINSRFYFNKIAAMFEKNVGKNMSKYVKNLKCVLI